MRKFLMAFIIVMTVMSLFLTVTSAVNKWGDANTDGTVDVADAVKLAQHLAGWSVTFSGDEKDSSDVYYDGVIDTKDAVLLAQFLAGWAVVLGKETQGGDTEQKPDIEVDIKELYDGLIIYPEFPSLIRRNYDYDISVTAGTRTEKLPVYNHTEESNVSRRSGADAYRRFSCFAFDGEGVRVDIKVKCDFTSYTVFPSAKNFKHEFKDGTISVYLDKPDYFGIQLDDDQNSIISIIADAPETNVPKKTDPNVIYIEGWYEPEGGILTVDKPGTTIYLAPGSVLNARVTISASDCKLIGRGAIADPFGNLYEYDIRVGGTEWLGNHPLDITKGTKNCLVDGVFFLDSRTHTIRALGSNHTMRNVKEFSTIITSDGIQYQCENSLAEHCYVYVGDNGIVVGSHYGNTFRDITIGTTCAALFPEAKADDILFEDIYVFRADDGIFNHFNISKGVEPEIDNIVVRRLSAMEMPEGLTHFFIGRSAGRESKVFTFEDISIPKLDMTVYYQNGGTYAYTDNYTLNFKNLYIGGKQITSSSQIDVVNTEKVDCTQNVTYDSSYKQIKRNMVTVNYKADKKVYIGSCRIFLSDVRTDGTNLLLPTGEICKALRVKKISDAEYVTAADLKAANAVVSYKTENGALYFTPVYNGENLLLPDEGEISRFAEQSAYLVDVVTTTEGGKTVYNVYNHSSSKTTPNGGVARQITNEVRMYGAGTYHVTLSVKGCEAGQIRLFVGSGGSTGEALKRLDFGTEWTDFSFDVTVTQEMVTSPKCVLRIVASQNILDLYSFKDLTLTKKN